VVHNTVELILVGLGLFFLIYASFVLLNLIRKSKTIVVKSSWIAFFCFVVFFMAGYIVFIFSLIEEIKIEGLNLVIANIFFFGAAFVFGISHLNNYQMKKSDDLADRLMANTLEVEGFRETEKKYSEELEDREKELKEKIDELEKFKKLIVGRELKMVQLKKRINDLEEAAKKSNGESQIK